MRKSLSNALLPALVLALPFAASPQALTAQEQAEPQQCTAEVLPLEVAAGQPAVRVAFTLSEDVGTISAIQAPEDTGILIAAPEDLPRQDMANPDTPPKPIEMSREDANVAVLWLNTNAAVPGTHEVSLTGENGSCVAHLTVTGDGSF